MVLAEVAASGDLPRWTDAAAAADLAGSPARLSGAILSAGLAIGTVVLHEPRISVPRPVAEDAEPAECRPNAALREIYSSPDRMFAAADLAHPCEHRDITEPYLMYAHDRGLFRPICPAMHDTPTTEAA